MVNIRKFFTKVKYFDVLTYFLNKRILRSEHDIQLKEGLIEYNETLISGAINSIKKSESKISDLQQQIGILEHYIKSLKHTKEV